MTIIDENPRWSRCGRSQNGRGQRQPWFIIVISSTKFDVVNELVDIPDPAEPATALAAVVSMRRTADRLELAAVQVAIDEGWSWAPIADSLGVTPQAAHKRLARRIRKDPTRKASQ
jgi:hypothetical protein